MVTKWRKKFMDNALGLGCRINPGKWSRMNQIDAEGQRFQLWEVPTSTESNRQQDRLGLIRVLNLISGVYFPWKSYISSPRQWLVLIYTFSYFSRFLEDFSKISWRFLEDFSKISQRFWENFEKISRTFRKNFGKISGKCRENFGKISGKFRENFGKISGKFWENFGKISGNGK